MPLLLDPDRLPRATLEALHASMRESLAETLDLVEAPIGRVLAPAGLEAAGELVRAALAIVDARRERDAATLAAETNLAYASMVAAIDLVKSHTDAPRVPAPRSRRDRSGG